MDENFEIQTFKSQKLYMKHIQNILDFNIHPIVSEKKIFKKKKNYLFSLLLRIEFISFQNGMRKLTF